MVQKVGARLLGCYLQTQGTSACKALKVFPIDQSCESKPESNRELILCLDFGKSELLVFFFLIDCFCLLCFFWQGFVETASLVAQVGLTFTV